MEKKKLEDLDNLLKIMRIYGKKSQNKDKLTQNDNALSMIIKKKKNFKKVFKKKFKNSRIKET